MRLPKTCNICGKIFTIKVNPNNDGGSVDCDKKIITIGTFVPDEIAENVLHEIGEAIMMVRGFRYAHEMETPENEDYQFVLNHKDWMLFNKDLAAALKGISFK